MSTSPCQTMAVVPPPSEPEPQPASTRAAASRDTSTVVRGRYRCIETPWIRAHSSVCGEQTCTYVPVRARVLLWLRAFPVRNVQVMRQQERLGLILERLSRHGSVDVGELAAELSVSQASVRRDLQLLEGQQLLTRTHGGAV